MKNKKLVNISLTNRNRESQDCQVIINLNTKLCRFSNNKEMTLNHLINKSDFIHPLITEPITQTENQIFHYEYTNIAELFYSGIYVYARLLHAANPLACQFKISPSPQYVPIKCPEYIDFSINSHQSAQEAISIKQLEALITHLLGLKFIYSDDVIIDDSFTIENLPDTVNGDLLYETNNQLIEQLKISSDVSRFELRFIDPVIGFGVFSKKIITKEESIAFYTGLKKSQKSYNSNYSFGPSQDCLEMYLDAIEHGNITRFINHAPNDKPKSSNASLLEANVETEYWSSNGIHIVLYVARRDILPGEQLLIDYGKKYFQTRPLILFKTNGQLMNTNKKLFWRHSQNKLNYLRIMADHGVKKAQQYMRIRIFIIVFIIILLMNVLHLFH